MLPQGAPESGEASAGSWCWPRVARRPWASPSQSRPDAWFTLELMVWHDWAIWQYGWFMIYDGWYLMINIWWFMLVSDGWNPCLSMVSTGSSISWPWAWTHRMLEASDDPLIPMPDTMGPSPVTEPRLSPAKLSRQSCRRNLSQVHWNSSTRDGYLQQGTKQPKCNDKPTPVQHVLHNLWEEGKARKSSWTSQVVSSVKCLVEKWRTQTWLSYFIQYLFHRFSCPHKFVPDSKFTASEVATDPAARISKVIVATRKPEMHFKPAWRIKITSSVWFSAVFDGTTWQLGRFQLPKPWRNSKIQRVVESKVNSSCTNRNHEFWSKLLEPQARPMLEAFGPQQPLNLWMQAWCFPFWDSFCTAGVDFNKWKKSARVCPHIIEIYYAYKLLTNSSERG